MALNYLYFQFLRQLMESAAQNNIYFGTNQVSFIIELLC